MTRSARRRRDRVTVEELLRQAGATPRTLGSRPSGKVTLSRAVRRLRSERATVAREVDLPAAPTNRGLFRRVALASGGTIAFAALALLVFGPGGSPADPTSLPFVPLPPASLVQPPPAIATPSDVTSAPEIMTAAQSGKSGKSATSERSVSLRSRIGDNHGGHRR